MYFCFFWKFDFCFSKVVHFFYFSFYRRSGGLVVKRIDNYGPPNAKSPFGANDEKLEAKTDIKNDDTGIKKSESQSIDKNILQATDSSGKLLRFSQMISFENLFYSI